MRHLEAEDVFGDVVSGLVKSDGKVIMVNLTYNLH